MKSVGKGRAQTETTEFTRPKVAAPYSPATLQFVTIFFFRVAAAGAVPLAGVPTQSYRTLTPYGSHPTLVSLPCSLDSELSTLPKTSQKACTPQNPMVRYLFTQQYRGAERYRALLVSATAASLPGPWVCAQGEAAPKRARGGPKLPWQRAVAVNQQFMALNTPDEVLRGTGAMP